MSRHHPPLLCLLTLLLAVPAVAAPPPADLHALAGHWVAGQGAEDDPRPAFPPRRRRRQRDNHPGRHRPGRVAHLERRPRGLLADDPAARFFAAGAAALITGPWEQETPKPAGLVRVHIRLERDAAGRVTSLAFLDGALVEAHGELWMRLDEPAAAYLNWQLLAGTYPDAKVRPWTFTADGHTTWPDRSFAYEVSIDESKADCDYVFFAQPGEVGGYRRYGFRRAKGTLRLYSIAYLKNGAAPIHCDKVIAELRSGRSSWERRRLAGL